MKFSKWYFLVSLIVTIFLFSCTENIKKVSHKDKNISGIWCIDFESFSEIKEKEDLGFMILLLTLGDNAPYYFHIDEDLKLMTIKDKYGEIYETTDIQVVEIGKKLQFMNNEGETGALIVSENRLIMEFEEQQILLIKCEDGFRE